MALPNNADKINSPSGIFVKPDIIETTLNGIGDTPAVKTITKPF